MRYGPTLDPTMNTLPLREIGIFAALGVTTAIAFRFQGASSTSAILGGTVAFAAAALVWLVTGVELY